MEVGNKEDGMMSFIRNKPDEINCVDANHMRDINITLKDTAHQTFVREGIQDENHHHNSNSRCISPISRDRPREKRLHK